MTTGTLAALPPGTVLDPGVTGRRSAQAAAGLTVGAAAALGAFFTVGQPWGTVNDALSIVLAGTTVPIAVGLARRNPRSLPLAAGAALDVAGVAIATTFTSLLIAGRMSFEDSLGGVLGGHALIGGWLLLAGVAASSTPGNRRVAALGVVGGAGLLATAIGVQAGGMESPVATAGFAASLVGTTAFYALLGRRRPTP